MITPSRRIELLLWRCLPGLCTLLLALLCLLPKHLPGLDRFMPLLPLLPIFYWGLSQPREMPYWFVFLTGLLMDAGSGMPLGVSSLLYLFFLGVLRVQRDTIHKEGFIIKWGYFSILLAVMTSLSWLALSLYDAHLQNGFPAFMQWLLSIGCYPLFHCGFDKLHNMASARHRRLLHRH